MYRCRRRCSPMPMHFQVDSGEIVSIKWLVDTIYSHLPRPCNGTKTVEEDRIKKLTMRCDAVILLYSCTDRAGYKGLVDTWELQRSTHDHSSTQAALCEHLWVVANKKDSAATEKAVSSEEGSAWAREIGAEFRETSALNGEGTRDLVDNIVSSFLVDSRSKRHAGISACDTRSLFILTSLAIFNLLSRRVKH